MTKSVQSTNLFVYTIRNNIQSMHVYWTQWKGCLLAFHMLDSEDVFIWQILFLHMYNYYYFHIYVYIYKTLQSKIKAPEVKIHTCEQQYFKWEYSNVSGPKWAVYISLSMKRLSYFTINRAVRIHFYWVHYTANEL